MGTVTESLAPIPITSPVAPKIAARWRVCLHEAGHAVAGRRLLGDSARAIVYDDGAGAAYINRSDIVPWTFNEALAVAAGQAAEALAESCAPPDVPLPVPLEVAYPEQVEPLREQLRNCLSDAVAIARWCIGGIEEQPDRWAGRFHWIGREARIFVAMNREEIVDAARGLFGRGIITLLASR